MENGTVSKICLGITAGAQIYCGAYMLLDIFGGNGKHQPTDRTVQSGYIAPSQLEIQCKDLDGNGEKETIMNVGSNSYLLKEVNGNPVLVPYQVKVVEK